MRNYLLTESEPSIAEIFVTSAAEKLIAVSDCHHLFTGSKGE